MLGQGRFVLNAKHLRFFPTAFAKVISKASGSEDYLVEWPDGEREYAHYDFVIDNLHPPLPTICLTLETLTKDNVKFWRCTTMSGDVCKEGDTNLGLKIMRLTLAMEFGTVAEKIALTSPEGNLITHWEHDIC